MAWKVKFMSCFWTFIFRGNDWKVTSWVFLKGRMYTRVVLEYIYSVMCTLCVLDQDPGLLSWIRAPAESVFPRPRQLVFRDHSMEYVTVCDLPLWQQRGGFGFQHIFTVASVMQLLTGFTVNWWWNKHSQSETLASKSPAYLPLSLHSFTFLTLFFPKEKFAAKWDWRN